MPKFKVEVTRGITQNATVEVECACVEDAEDAALDAAFSEPSKFNWRENENHWHRDEYYHCGGADDIEEVV